MFGQETKLTTMNTEPRSPLLTWIFILSTFLLPAFILFAGRFSDSPAGSEIRMAVYGLIFMAVIGITLGFWVRPDSESAGLAVFGSPIVTVLASLVLFGGWDVLVHHTPVSSVLRSFCMMSIGLAFFSIPTAGYVRATHWFRDRNS